MLLADRVRDYSIGALGATDLEARYRKIEKQAKGDVKRAKLERFADIRYAGQSYELTIPSGGDFHKEHHRVYGYSDPKRATQTVTLRVRATVAVTRPNLKAKREVIMADRKVWVKGRWTKKPSLIVDYGSTTLVPPGWKIRTDHAGTLILTKLR